MWEGRGVVDAAIVEEARDILVVAEASGVISTMADAAQVIRALSASRSLHPEVVQGFHLPGELAGILRVGGEVGGYVHPPDYRLLTTLRDCKRLDLEPVADVGQNRVEGDVVGDVVVAAWYHGKPCTDLGGVEHVPSQSHDELRRCEDPRSDQELDCRGGPHSTKTLAANLRRKWRSARATPSQRLTEDLSWVSSFLCKADE